MKRCKWLKKKKNYLRRRRRRKEKRERRFAEEENYIQLLVHYSGIHIYICTGANHLILHIQSIVSNRLSLLWLTAVTCSVTVGWVWLSENNTRLLSGFMANMNGVSNLLDFVYFEVDRVWGRGKEDDWVDKGEGCTIEGLIDQWASNERIFFFLQEREKKKTLIDVLSIWEVDGLSHSYFI